MRACWVVAVSVACATPVLAETYRECMARRKALTTEALLEEDVDMRAKVLASLPVCRWDASAEPPKDCIATRKETIALAMEIADLESRGRALAAIEQCPSANAASVARAAEAEALPPPASDGASPFEIAAMAGFAVWSGPARFPAALGSLARIDVGYRIDRVSLLAFGAIGSLTGETVPDTYDASIRELGVRVRMRWQRFAVGVGTAYMKVQLSGNGLLYIARTDNLGLLAADVAVSAFAIGPVRVELFGVLGGTTSANALGELGAGLRL